MITDFVGQCVINLYKTLKYIVTGRVNIKNTLIQSAIIGYDSVPIALVIALVSGAVLALQVSRQFVLTGAESNIGGLISVAIIREMAPIFAALSIGARAGTAIAAEIANMQVTEQIDAIKTLKIDPIEYIFVPRIIAGVFMVPLVTILSEFIGIMGGMWIADFTVDVHPNRYLNSVWLYTSAHDIEVSLIKAATFGLLITLICATHGMTTKGGAREVGITTTKAAIGTALAILVFDYFLTWIFYG
ncbi:MAG: ABC transporter permease [Candidatus Gastranaerophilales bacterium]|nr:ABC transporter permease [Candidatus Gastranaerophilales bacterium]